MKKHLKTLAKKSIALLMTVMMLMTCWVFVAPEQNQASAANSASNFTAEQIKAFEEYVAGTSGSGKATVEGVSGKYFAGDTKDASSLYKNVVYSGMASKVASVGATKIRDDGALESFGVYYPVTVLMYDGVTNPQFGVSIHKDAKNNCEVRHWGTSISGNNLGLVGNWRGFVKDSYDTIIFADAYYGGNESCGYNYTGTASESNYYGGDKGAWFWLANLIQYTGSLSDATYYTTATPGIKTYVGQPNSASACEDSNATNVTVDLGNGIPVYIINTKVWNQAVYEAIDLYTNTIKGNEARYSNLAAYKAAVQALFDCNPNNYSWADDVSGKVSEYAAAAKAAVDAWNAFELAEVSFTVSFIDVKGTTTETVVYGNGVASSKFPEADGKAYDDNNHYAFAGWSLSKDGSTGYITSLSNVTSTTSVYAVYTGTAHDFTPTANNANIHYNGNSTHSWQCSGCAALGVKDGIAGSSVDCTLPDTWSGGASEHYKICTVCSGKTKHTPTWTETKFYNKTPASCTDYAVYYLQCTVEGCGVSSETHGNKETWTDTSVVPQHNYVHIKEEPDCFNEKNGVEKDVCSVCGDVINYKETPYEHTPSSTLANLIDGNDKQHMIVCDVCLKELGVTADHVWESMGPKAKPTCTTNGTYRYYCTLCGYEIESEYKIDANGQLTTELVARKLDHKNGDESAYEYYEDATHQPQDPTCSAEGYHYEKCSLCGDIKQVTDPIDPDAHDWADATPAANDQHTATCNLCGTVDTTDCVDEDKNCVCDKCNDGIAHVYDKEVVADKYLATEATCTADATYYRSCQCGAFEVDAANTFVVLGSALGHEYNEESDVIRSEATCTEAQTNWYGCSRCDANAKDDSEAADKYYSVGDPLGHNYTGKIVNNGDGTHSYNCQNGCGTIGYNGVTGDSTGCNYGAWDTTNANGHQHTCLDCGYVSALEAHKWAEDGSEGWKPATGNTDSAAGEMTRTCLICSRVETTACVYDSVNVVDATCMNDKYTEYTCTACGHGYTVIEANTKLDHSYTGEYDIDEENDKHRQLCVKGCNEYGEWVECELTYTQVTDTETHTAECPACGNVDTGDCFGGTATCIEKAKCDKCGGYHGDYADHDFSGTAVNVGEGKHKYNCTTDGCDEYGEAVDCFGGTAYCDAKKICDACKTAYGELDPNSHKNTTAQPGKAPTCMQTGYTDYETCDACGTELGKEEISINPDAHKWDQKAVSTNDGKHYYACINEDTAGVTCTAKDVYDCVCTSPSILPPTCTEAGHTKNYCDECNYYWETEPTDPIKHAWGEWTEDGKGGHSRVCANDPDHVEIGTCADDATAVVTAPTCTEMGYTTYTCNVCGYEWVADYTDPTGHHYTQKVIDAAHLFTAEDYEACGITSSTCERADYYWFDCADCDKNGKDETDADKYALNTRYYENGKGEGHKFVGEAYSEKIKDKLVLATPATCTEHETYYTYCTECYLSTKGIEGKEATFTRWGTAIEHSFENIVDEENPAKNRVSVATCTAKAVYYESCKNCGEVGEDTFTYGEMTDHVYTKKMSDYAHKITDATCKTVATYWYNCEYCNSNAKLLDTSDMTEAEIAALQYTDGTYDLNNHVEFTNVAYKAPTCLEDGHSEYKKCVACGTEIGKVTRGYEKTGHSYTGAYRIANVIDSEGNVTAYKHQRACKYGCGTYSEATECGFSAWKQNADGKTHTMACVCGNSLTKDCVANDNASCVDAATCKDCGGAMADTITGHDWGEWKSDNNGKTHTRVCKTNTKHTETENCSGGVASGCGAIYCSVCNQQYATGVDHAWGEWVEVSPATCTAAAVHMRACGACSATEEESYGAALGHDYDKDNDGINDGVVTKEATCTEAGVKTFTCLNNCGETYTEVIKSLGHALEAEWTTVSEPTCKDEGLQVKCCTHSWKDADGKEVKCDYYEEQTIPADKSKHVAGEWVADEGASNCETGLKSYKYCTVCGLKVDEKTEQISHEWVADTIVYGTCTANGYIKMICAKCGSAKVFDENTPGFPNKMDDTVIDGETAAKLLTKGGHKWETSTSSTAEYVIQDGYVVYVTKAPTCSETGKGYMICTAEGCGIKSSTVAINKTAHNFKTMPASEATCQTPGHTAYQACRNCAYAEQPTKIPKLGHIDANSNGKCDRCGFEMYNPGNGGTAACGCICHNNSFFMAKIIYPIARFFWKIFKMNKSCSCGKVHY